MKKVNNKKTTANSKAIKATVVDKNKDSEMLSIDASNIAFDTAEQIDETLNIKVKKNSLLYEALSNPTGATMEELIDKLGWQKHSIRGVLSNMQKEQQFTLMTLSISRPDFDNGGFIKETRYFIRDAEFDVAGLFANDFNGVKF